ncbi:MAG: hypothetical protein UT02_C0049G0008 [Parcubacteria group bacterium GW2011_GWC2_38_7]|nr:MAG: hypothetical protein UT02_C0049G0008 [Parcubacteria group bacterium GW2011_GWC2_38_7]
MRGPIMTTRKIRLTPLALDLSIMVTRNFRTKRPEILLVLPKIECLVTLPPVHCLPTTEFATGNLVSQRRSFLNKPAVEESLCDHDVNQTATRLAGSLGLEIDPKLWYKQYFHSDRYRDKRTDKRRISMVMRFDLETNPKLEWPYTLQVNPMFIPLFEVPTHLGFDHGAYIELLQKEWKLNDAVWQENPDGSFVHLCANMLAVQAQAKVPTENGGFPNYVRPVEKIVWDPEGYPVIWLRHGLDHEGLVCLPGAVKNCPYCGENLSFGPQV